MTWATEIERLRSLTCAKWTWYDPDVIPAWVADMDFLPAPVVTDAMRELIDRGDLGYNFAAYGRIPEVFAERQSARFGWSPSPEHARLFDDVMQAVETVLWLNTTPGDGVVLFTPVYAPFYKALEATGCRVIDVPLDEDTWRLDSQRLADAIDERTRIILTCDPHNPSGRSFGRDELEAIAEVAERHDLLIVSDEIWADITYPPARHIPIASLSPDVESRTVTITAASKAFNLAGLRCAIAHLGHRPTAEKIAELPGHLFGAVNSLGAEATLAAWTLGDAWLADTLGVLEGNRDHLARRLAAELPQVRFTVPEATYLAWLDFSAVGLGDEPAERLLETARVALSRGLDFGSAGAGRARLNFATNRELLDELIDRLVGALTTA